MKISKHLLLLAVAIVGGLGAAVTTAIAADDLQLLCYRNRTIQVPSYLVARYVFKGASAGACIVTQ